MTEAEDDFVQPEGSSINNEDSSKIARCEDVRPRSIQEMQERSSFKDEQKLSEVSLAKTHDYLEPKSYRSFEPAAGSDVIDLD